MIKNLGKFFQLPIHEFHDFSPFNQNDQEPLIEKLALVHSDKYFIFGILVEKQYFQPIKKDILLSLDTDPHSDFIRKLKNNYPLFIINSYTINDLKSNYIGFITLNEYLSKYEPEKLKKSS